MAIKEARSDEASVLAEIQRRASVAAFPHIFPPQLYPFPVEDVRQRWVDALGSPGTTVLVGEADGVPVGIAGYRTDWLDGLYVVPELWGSGIAGELHDCVLERLRERGSLKCHLWVIQQNERARRFYERRGWSENGETEVVPFPPNPLHIGYTIDLAPGGESR